MYEFFEALCITIFYFKIKKNFKTFKTENKTFFLVFAVFTVASRFQYNHVCKYHKNVSAINVSH